MNPGVFGVFYQNDRPTKNRARGKRCEMDEARTGELRAQRINALEKKWVDQTREKLGQPSDLALLQKTFDRMK